MRNKKPAERNFGVDLDASVIRRWQTLHPATCTLVNSDAVEFLTGFAFNGDELVYADPPYVTSTRRRAKIYRHEYDDADHERLLRVLVTLPCKVIISGYESALYNEALANWRCAGFSSMSHTGVRAEMVWYNFDTPQQLHDATYLGNSFRDRQTIRRRHDRLLDRFARMAPVERHHVLDLLNSRFGAHADRHCPLASVGEEVAE